MLTSKSRGADVKIIDFGLAKLLDADGETASFLGTRGYLAPEMLQRQAYSMSVDMWALGIIVYILLCGCLPFDDESSKIANDKAARVGGAIIDRCGRDHVDVNKSLTGCVYAGKVWSPLSSLGEWSIRECERFTPTTAWYVQ